MHKFFANWYGLARPEPPSETLNSRWAGIEAYCQGIQKDSAFELVRLFFGLPLHDESSEDTFRQSFKDADTAFFMKDNNLEVQVLAGSAIISILEQVPSHATDATALAVLCADCRSLRAPMIFNDVILYARDYIAKETDRVRQSDVLSTVEITAPIQTQELKALGSALKDGSLQTTPDLLVKLLEKSMTAMVELSRATEKSVSALRSNLENQQEETNILWWLFGEQSRDREKYVGDIDLPGLCLLVGKELADLTILQPGSRPAPAFMDRMLRTGRANLPASTTIAEAVNSSSREWRRAWMNSGDPTTFGDISPVHFATSKSLETEEASAWIPMFESRTGLKAAHAIGPLDLAIQTYQESLLLRLAKQ
ncbi:MAG TPA: GTPase-associated system all-helical protein GASH [Pyrinomonadaceae bacterium]|nr:GTPase-associated system all-helical protein GASH [Pyrinomonadaceae bacterium]